MFSSIATAFKTKVTAFERHRNISDYTYFEKGYLLTVNSLASRISLIDYFTEFPLLTSKRLDYLNWVEAHEIVGHKNYRTVEGTTRLQELKSSMNSQRIYFNWEHLDELF